MLKIMGLMALVAAAGFAGVLKAAELKERIRLLEEFLKMTLTLKGRIQYFRQPLIPLFAQVGTAGNTSAFHLLKQCRKQLEEKQGEISQVWIQEAEKIYGRTAITGEDLEIICHMGSFIGQTDYENQQMQFSFLETRLQEQLTEAREDCRQKGPMYRRIGFFGGAIAALVLL